MAPPATRYLPASTDNDTSLDLKPGQSGLGLSDRKAASREPAPRRSSFLLAIWSDDASFGRIVGKGEWQGRRLDFGLPPLPDVERTRARARYAYIWGVGAVSDDSKCSDHFLRGRHQPGAVLDQAMGAFGERVANGPGTAITSLPIAAAALAVMIAPLLLILGRRSPRG